MLVAASQQFKLAELCLTQQHQNATPAAARRPPPTMSPPPAQVFVSSAVAPQHELPGHFERPARVSVVLQSLKDANLVASAFPGQVCSYRRRADTTHVSISGNVDRLVKIVRLLPALLPAAQIHDVPAAKAPMEAVRRMHTYAEALEQRAAAHQSSACPCRPPVGPPWVPRGSQWGARLTMQMYESAVMSDATAAADAETRTGRRHASWGRASWCCLRAPTSALPPRHAVFIEAIAAE